MAALSICCQHNPSAPKKCARLNLAEERAENLRKRLDGLELRNVRAVLQHDGGVVHQQRVGADHLLGEHVVLSTNHDERLLQDLRVVDVVLLLAPDLEQECEGRSRLRCPVENVVKVRGEPGAQPLVFAARAEKVLAEEAALQEPAAKKGPALSAYPSDDALDDCDKLRDRRRQRWR
eukprot:6212189-Pleurochrysis_carterae.AAC.10